MMSCLRDKRSHAVLPGKRLFEHGGCEGHNISRNLKCPKVDAVQRFPRNCRALAHQVSETCSEGHTRVETVTENSKIESQINILPVKPRVKLARSELKFKATKPLVSRGEVDVTGLRIPLKNMETRCSIAKRKVELENGRVNDSTLEQIDALDSSETSSKPCLRHRKYPAPKFQKGVNIFLKFPQGCARLDNASSSKCEVLPNVKSGVDTVSDDSGKHGDTSIVLSDSQADFSRLKVQEALNLFKPILEKHLLNARKVSVYTYQDAAMELKEQGKWVNMNKRVLGAVPGVEIGDKFHCRAELVIIGLHHPFSAGIDFMDIDGKKIATSIVASGRYVNETEFTDVLIYSGEGGNPAIKDKKLEDQTLVRGNLALKNSMEAGTPVRVIRGCRVWKSYRAGDRKREKEATFTYDGLYVVSKYWQDKGKYGKLVFMFQLNKMQGQPNLAPNILSSSGKSKILSKSRLSKALCRSGKSKLLIRSEKSKVCHDKKTVDDISCGKEKIPIRVVNDIDNEKPSIFNYIANMVYPQLNESSMTRCCQCIDGCSDYVKCSCVIKNRGTVPYNENGAIVRRRPIVYECGPFCKCPPSCKNRVSQRGVQFQLEVFKTESRGWGVRSRNFISSGSFICEYVGELLNDKQADERTDCDEYLFDLGDGDGFAIDAAQFGNIGRFLNHSCSPNLYAQDVLFDHDNKKMPHVMLFATKNIPPLQELTFHYNYKIGQVYDMNGNVKKKTCCCGARDCTGRMY